MPSLGLNRTVATSSQQPFQRILVIQTAFLGDVILSTALVEALALAFPSAQIDFLLRRGNEVLLEHNPHLHTVLVWDKKHGKLANLLKTSSLIRQNKYDLVLCLQRFLSGGLFAVRSGAREVRGFSQNPLSAFFSKSFRHSTSNGLHEVERNHELLSGLTDVLVQRPRLYPRPENYQNVDALAMEEHYIVIAPSSVWFTKMWPKQKWAELITLLPSHLDVVLIGSGADRELCEEIIRMAERGRNLAGQLSLLDSAALIAGAKLTYTNDSGPLHIASAMNAPVASVFCSTVPEFGFGPLSDERHILQETVGLKCRPCGLHGHKACPEGHFLCAKVVSAAEAAQVTRNK